jgi:hypothetical protein
MGRAPCRRLERRETEDSQVNFLLGEEPFAIAQDKSIVMAAGGADLPGAFLEALNYDDIDGCLSLAPIDPDDRING